MPNSLTSTGLTTATQAELSSNFTTGFEAIYGPDINLASDTPDGQSININIQAILDQEDLLTEIYNSFDPDRAVGVVLDSRVAINGIQRKGGTNTITPVTIVTSKAINLNGLDNAFPSQPLYVVSDNAGNNWVLVTSQVIAGAGSYIFTFQAQNTGAILTVPNTITIPVTIILGVVSVNNPTTYTSLGIAQETDAALRIRRQQSVAIPAQGYLASLRAGLLNIIGVTYAQVYENVTDATDGDGIPGHSIWVVINGGNNADIANVIYNKRNSGCGMKGSVFVNIHQVDGTLFQVRWDVVIVQQFYFKFNAHSINGVDAIDTAGIANYVAANFTSGVFQTININDLATLVRQFDPNCLLTAEGLSLTFAGTYTNTLSPTAKNNQFVIPAGNIAITVV